MKSKIIITVSGSPGAGKTTLCLGLSHYFSSQGRNVFYAHEWVKDWANRKVPLAPIDQFGVFGNQTLLISSGIKAGCDIVTSCTSPALCAFYSDFYSGGTGVFDSLILATRQFESECFKNGYTTFNFFLDRSEEDYQQYFKQEGRYETLEQSMDMQERMKNWFMRHFPETKICRNLDIFAIEKTLEECI